MVMIILQMGIVQLNKFEAKTFAIERAIYLLKITIAN